MTNRLVTFGCSITFGDHLPDVQGNIPSRLAWPQVLADSLGYTVDNCGVRGCSNFQILHNILNYKFKPTDCVVIMWSFTDRDMLFGRKSILGQQIIPIGMWQDTELSKHWTATHSADDVATRTWYYIHHVGLHLESLGIPYYNVFARYKELKKFKPKNLKVKIYDIKIDSSMPVDFAGDMRHPGPKTNYNIAYRIKEIINEN